VFDDERPRHTLFTGSEAGERRHHEAVGKFVLAEGQRGKQHAQFLSGMKWYCSAQLAGVCNYSACEGEHPLRLDMAVKP
jgi:hypothetical protein